MTGYSVLVVDDEDDIRAGLEIYERFKRGDQSKHTEGSGLGLAIAKSITELQGGKLNIEIDGNIFKVTVEFNK